VRHNLENFKKRLKALEEKVANDGIILNDAQVAALEKKKHDEEIEQPTLVIWGRKTPSMSVTSKVLAVSISKRLLIPTAKSLLRSSISPKRP